jgi:hypothetical protein
MPVPSADPESVHTKSVARTLHMPFTRQLLDVSKRGT